MTTADRYAHLVRGSKRSKDDWIERLSKPILDDMIALGALESVDHSELDGFEGRFRVADGMQELRLHVSQGVIIADPFEGGQSLRLDQSKLVFRANPEKLFKKIADSSGFSLCKANPGQSPMITFAQRTIENKIFKALIVLDTNWIGSFSAQFFVEEMVKGAESVILLVDQEFPSFPWNLAGKIDRRVDRIPMASNGWRIPREWYCDPRFGISTKAIVAEYPEKKIVFDGVNKKFVILGHEVNVRADSRPYDFLRGLCLMGTSPMATDMFAKKYLGYHADDGNEIARAARTQASKAIEKAITDPATLKTALGFCTPETANKTVKSAFNPEDILILGS